MKSASVWECSFSSTCGGTDDFKFSALPGGYRGYDGVFGDIGCNGVWWTATELSGGDVNGTSMNFYSGNAFDFIYDKSYVIYVRCVQD